MLGPLTELHIFTGLSGKKPQTRKINEHVFNPMEEWNRRGKRPALCQSALRPRQRGFSGDRRQPLPNTCEGETGNNESLSGAPRKVKPFIPYS